MRLSEISDIIAGMVFNGSLPVNAVDHSKLEYPYDEMLKDMQGGMNSEELNIKYGWQPTQTALASADGFTMGKEITKDMLTELVSTLNKVHIRYQLGRVLADKSKELMDGKYLDPYEIIENLREMDEERQEFRTMDSVTAEQIKWVPTNTPYIDTHVGGQNPNSLNLIAAAPGTGKTSTLLSIMAASLRLGNKIALLSLELSAEIVRMRLGELAPDLTDDELKNLIIIDDDVTVNNLRSTIARLVYKYPDLSFIGLDYIEMLVPDRVEETAGLTGMIYRTLQKAAKVHKVVIWALCQFSRAYSGGVPRVNNIRFSGLAEASAAIILMLYKQSNVLSGVETSQQKKELPRCPDGGYVIVGKSRFGYVHGGVGAIQLPWDSTVGVWEQGAVGLWTEINM